MLCPGRWSYASERGRGYKNRQSLVLSQCIDFRDVGVGLQNLYGNVGINNSAKVVASVICQAHTAEAQPYNSHFAFWSNPHRGVVRKADVITRVLCYRID